jgi:hypothetical protein
MKKYGRTDENQTRIVSKLRQAHCRVLSLASTGGGCPDLLVYRPTTGLLYMLEIKNGDKVPSRRKLTPHQVKFHKDWPVQVVNDIDEALKACGI